MSVTRALGGIRPVWLDFRPKHRMKGCSLVIYGQGVAGTSYVLVYVRIEDFKWKDPLAVEPRHLFERKAIRSYSVPQSNKANFRWGYLSLIEVLIRRTKN
jgi:hypothetical protein